MLWHFLLSMCIGDYIIALSIGGLLYFGQLILDNCCTTLGSFHE